MSHTELNKYLSFRFYLDEQPLEKCYLFHCAAPNLWHMNVYSLAFLYPPYPISTSTLEVYYQPKIVSLIFLCCIVSYGSSAPHAERAGHVWILAEYIIYEQASVG